MNEEHHHLEDSVPLYENTRDVCNEIKSIVVSSNHYFNVNGYADGNMFTKSKYFVATHRE